MTEHRFSVLMSIYSGDSAEYIIDAINSLEKQTHRPDEIVIVIDGPVNRTIQEALTTAKNKNSTIKTKQLEINTGLAHALNEGLALCSHELVARMDADDYALPERFEKMIKIIAHDPDICILGGQHRVYCSKLEKEEGIRRVPLKYDDIIKYSKYRTPINHPTIIFRKSKIIKLNGYPENIGRFEDWGLCLKVINANYKIENIADIVLKVRGGDQMMNRRRGLKYFLEEISALISLQREGLLKKSYVLMNILVRAPFRFAPESLLNLIYKKALRN